jgi:hypothetical protein
MYTSVSGTAAVRKGKNHWLGSALKGLALDIATVSYTEFEGKKPPLKNLK